MDKKDLNIHDPHEQYTWAEDVTPAWVALLKVLGIISGAVGMATLCYLFTVFMFVI
tara:strand:- start:439 stop:606 length:168 start_codon:yes stop_codon:yes gene_type:complete